DTIHKDNIEMSKWIPRSLAVPAAIIGETSVQLIITISDFATNVNVTEAGLDLFSISEGNQTGLTEFDDEVEIFPNPFNDQLIVRGLENGTIELYDLSGKRILLQRIEEFVSVVNVEPGLYIAVLRDDVGSRILTKKLIKE
ncbi:T9SS type A sorting domain-containing protein, partial [Crocinitomix catalasitica]|nr:T9SS type A sorting domain-containing protein [Crocinitomix catalasitica]